MGLLEEFYDHVKYKHSLRNFKVYDPEIYYIRSLLNEKFRTNYSVPEIVELLKSEDLYS